MVRLVRLKYVTAPGNEILTHSLGRRRMFCSEKSFISRAVVYLNLRYNIKIT
jgi:hypothetical protein